MSREIHWRWPTAEEAAAVFRYAIARVGATESEFDELLALPTDGTPEADLLPVRSGLRLVLRTGAIAQELSDGEGKRVLQQRP